MCVLELTGVGNVNTVGGFDLPALCNTFPANSSIFAASSYSIMFGIRDILFLSLLYKCIQISKFSIKNRKNLAEYYLTREYEVNLLWRLKICKFSKIPP